MAGTIDYGNLMHEAMRGLILKVLQDVERDGLPGEHHFFITFDTRHPDVLIADWLHDRYPSEMTVVMQHWYDNLEVTPVGFSVTLNFGDAPEPLYIPYDAIRTFVDPSVEFGLRFENPPADEDELDDDDGEHSVEHLPDPVQDPVGDAPLIEEAEDETPHQKAEVVSLDSFRK